MMIYYQLKTIWNSSHWAVLILGLLVPVVFTPPSPGVATPEPATAGYVIFILQSFLPLVGILTMASLLSREEEGSTAETLLSTPYSRKRLVFLRFGLGILYTAIVIAGVTLLYVSRGHLPPASIKSALLAATAPALFLGSLAMLLSGLTRSTAVGMLSCASYWLFDFYTRGEYTGYLYLFSLGNARFAPEAGGVYLGIPWWMNKGLLFFGALILLGLSTLWFQRRGIK